MIHITDDFLSDHDCDELIKIYEENCNNSYEYCGGFPLDITKELIDCNKIIQDTYYKIEEICQDLNDQDNNIFCDTFQIIKRNTFSFLSGHYDSENTKFSCILYLNDNYDGGSTVVKCDNIVKVKGKGKLLIIKDPDKIYHSMETITSGTRYIIAIWFESNTH